MDEQDQPRAGKIGRRTFLLALAGVVCLPALVLQRKTIAMDRIDRLMALFHRRWACPVMAELHRAQGAKFVSLVHALGANASSVRLTLNELIDLGWIRRNPGYGHPLRPEYILTRRGERLAPTCARLNQAVQAAGAHDVALRKWSMPTLYVIGDGPTRFTQVTDALGCATDRAVSLALKDLSGAGMIDRHLVHGPPPGSVYGATPIGERFLPILQCV